MNETKIIVLKRKHLIICALGALAILLAILLLMSKKTQTPVSTAIAGRTQTVFAPSATASDNSTDKYIPGIYTYVFSLNDTLLSIEVTVDANHINSVSISNLDDSVAAMYPLIEPSVSDIEAQLVLDYEPDEVTLSDNAKYTSLLLLEAVKGALAKAEK